MQLAKDILCQTNTFSNFPKRIFFLISVEGNSFWQPSAKIVKSLELLQIDLRLFILKVYFSGSCHVSVRRTDQFQIGNAESTSGKAGINGATTDGLKPAGETCC